MTLPPGKSLKSDRIRLARAELLVDLAVTAERWATRDTGISSADTFDRLAALYDLTDDDLGKIMRRIAENLERCALRAGYDEHWDQPEVPAGGGRT